MPFQAVELLFAALNIISVSSALLAFTNARGLAKQVNTLEGEIRRSLEEIKQDNKNTRELMHIIVRGAMEKTQ